MLSNPPPKEPFSPGEASNPLQSSFSVLSERHFGNLLMQKPAARHNSLLNEINKRNVFHKAYLQEADTQLRYLHFEYITLLTHSIFHYLQLPRRWSREDIPLQEQVCPSSPILSLDLFLQLLPGGQT